MLRCSVRGYPVDER